MTTEATDSMAIDEEDTRNDTSPVLFTIGKSSRSNSKRSLPSKTQTSHSSSDAKTGSNERKTLHELNMDITSHQRPQTQPQNVKSPSVITTTQQSSSSPTAAQSATSENISTSKTVNPPSMGSTHVPFRRGSKPASPTNASTPTNMPTSTATPSQATTSPMDGRKSTFKALPSKSSVTSVLSPSACGGGGASPSPVNGSESPLSFTGIHISSPPQRIPSTEEVLPTGPGRFSHLHSPPNTNGEQQQSTSSSPPAMTPQTAAFNLGVTSPMSRFLSQKTPSSTTSTFQPLSTNGGSGDGRASSKQGWSTSQGAPLSQSSDGSPTATTPPRTGKSDENGKEKEGTEGSDEDKDVNPMQEDDPMFTIGSPNGGSRTGSRKHGRHHSRRSGSKSKPRLKTTTTATTSKDPQSTPKFDIKQTLTNFESCSSGFSTLGTSSSTMNIAAMTNLVSPTSGISSTFSFGSPSQIPTASVPRTTVTNLASSVEKDIVPGLSHQLPTASGGSPLSQNGGTTPTTMSTVSSTGATQQRESGTTTAADTTSPTGSNSSSPLANGGFQYTGCAAPTSKESQEEATGQHTAAGKDEVSKDRTESPNVDPAGTTSSSTTEATVPEGGDTVRSSDAASSTTSETDPLSLLRSTKQRDTRKEVKSVHPHKKPKGDGKLSSRARSVPAVSRSRSHKKDKNRHNRRKEFGGPVDKSKLWKHRVIEFPRDENGNKIFPPLTEEEEEEYKQRGNQLYRETHYKEATETYTELIERGGDRAVYYGNRAACYWVLNQFDKCLQDSLKAICIDTGFYKGHARAAKVCLYNGDLVSARTHFNNALKCNADAAKNLHKDLAELNQAEKLLDIYNLYLKERQTVKALETAKQLCEQLPQALPMQILQLEVMCILQPREAQEVATKLLATHTEHPQLLYLASKANCYTNTLTVAKHYLAVAVEVDPDHQQAAQLLKNIRHYEESKQTANTLFQNKQYEQAYNKYTELLGMEWINDITSLKAVVYCNRAAAGKELGKYKAAIDDCSTAIRLNPFYTKAFLRRGRLYVCVSDYSGAIHDFETVLQTDSSNREASEELKEARKQQWSSHQTGNEKDATHTDPKYHYHSSHHHNYFKNMGNSSNKFFGGAHSLSNSKKEKKETHYDTLGITKGSTVSDIKSAFRKLALRYHPDKVQTSTDKEKGDAEKKFKTINEAYNVLSDDQKRADYDRKLINESLNDGFNYFYTSNRYNRSHWHY